MKPFLLVPALLTLAACVGGEHGLYLQSLQTHAGLTVAQSLDRPNEYIVSVRTFKDIGYDTDDKPTRERLAVSYIKDQCPNGQVIGESAIVLGSPGLLGQAKSYSIRVRCV